MLTWALGLQANYAFGAEKGLGLDVSLFERLVSQKNMPVHRLLVQRRMRPEIADLIRFTIYKDLVDGENVKGYPHVAGERTDQIGKTSASAWTHIVNSMFWHGWTRAAAD